MFSILLVVNSDVVNSDVVDSDIVDSVDTRIKSGGTKGFPLLSACQQCPPTILIHRLHHRVRQDDNGDDIDDEAKECFQNAKRARRCTVECGSMDGSGGGAVK